MGHMTGPYSAAHIVHAHVQCTLQDGAPNTLKGADNQTIPTTTLEATVTTPPSHIQYMQCKYTPPSQQLPAKKAVHFRTSREKERH